MVTKRVLRPERLRAVPSQFSWLDHRLVRECHLDRCSTEALALYLFLVTVADAQGLSYYGDASVGARLGLPGVQLDAARQVLIDADPIAFGAVDRGLFPDAAVREQFPVPEPSRIEDPADERRGRASATLPARRKRARRLRGELRSGHRARCDARGRARLPSGAARRVRQDHPPRGAWPETGKTAYGRSRLLAILLSFGHPIAHKHKIPGRLLHRRHRLSAACSPAEIGSSKRKVESKRPTVDQRKGNAR